MDTQEIVLTHNSDDGLYTRLLRGRYVTSINDGIITLDDGTELYIHGNEGCGGCESGWYWLENVYKQGSQRARIMSAYVAYGEDDEDAPSVYTLFVMVDGNPTQLPLATVRGDNGNGYYGTGFTLTATVKTRPAPPLTATPQDIIKVVAGEHPLPAIPDLRGRENLLNAVAYTLLQTRGFDSPLRITGPEAQLFHKLNSNQTGTKAPTTRAIGTAFTKQSCSGSPTWRKACPSSCATSPTERKPAWRNYATSQNECAPPRTPSRPSSPATP